MKNIPIMKCGHAANAETADNKPMCAICNCTELGIFDDYKDMTLIHSKDYVLKIARELNYTIEDVRSQVSRWFISRDLDGNLSTEEAIFFLRLFYADDIRYILTFNKEKEK